MALCLRTVPSVRPAAARPVAKLAVVRPVVVCRADQAKNAVEAAIKDAEAACADGKASDCAAAWDVVEEVSAAAADKKAVEKENSDPLEQYCAEDPAADECRVYDE